MESWKAYSELILGCCSLNAASYGRKAKRNTVIHTLSDTGLATH